MYYYSEQERRLDIWDYKHGVGIVVDAEHNPQLMYYGVGVLTYLELWERVDTIRLYIAQPRAHHYQGPIRYWEITRNALEDWLYYELVPATDEAMTSSKTASGEWCRFCPVRGRACPQMAKDFKAMERLITMNQAKELTPKQMGKFLDLFDTARIAAKAIGERAFDLLCKEKAVPGRKLVRGRSDRKWDDEAEEALRAKFGAEAYVAPKFKSPAQIEKLPQGDAFALKYSYKADASLTLARESDKRSVATPDNKHLFAEGKSK